MTSFESMQTKIGDAAIAVLPSLPKEWSEPERFAHSVGFGAGARWAFVAIGNERDTSLVASHRRRMMDRPRRVHDLKVWPEYFEAIERGAKSFEVRHNDRDYRFGDHLLLRSYDPVKGVYDGRELIRFVSYILHGPVLGVADGTVIMALGPVD